MLKRLWMIFGPVLIAGLLVFLLIFFYPTSTSYNLSEEKRYAAAISTQSFRERFQKVRALSDPNLRFIPFFGSSEWIRFDSMHPAVLAEKYNRSYRPYFLGQAGAASLNQYFGMQQILPELENKQAVFVISPQWFTETEYEPAVFRRYFNTDQLGAFLENQSGDVSSRYAAKRLMKKYPDVVLGDIVKKITEGEQLSEIDQTLIDTLARFNQKQSFLFGQLSVNDGEKYRDRVEKYLKDLPDKFSYDALREIAVKDAEANAEADKKRKEEVDLRNEVDQLIFTVDKTLKDLEGKVDAEDVKKAETARDELKAAVEANDLEAMKAKRDALNEVVQNLSVKLYEQAAASQAAQGAAGAEQASSQPQDGVVDADFEEVQD